MSNPFENKDGSYLVLINQERQYSLWPAFADVPPGWTVAHPQDSREVCLNFINQAWTDMRPQSLIDAMSAPEPRSDPGQAVATHTAPN